MSEPKGVLEHAIEYWNAADRDAEATLYAEDVVYEAPGGQRISGLADLEGKYFDALLTAAPDRLSRDIVLFADGGMWSSRRGMSGRTRVRFGARTELRFPRPANSSTFPLSESSASRQARSAPSASTTTRSNSSRSWD